MRPVLYEMFVFNNVCSFIPDSDKQRSNIVNICVGPCFAHFSPIH